jgi:hypothetical protein
MQNSNDALERNVEQVEIPEIRQQIDMTTIIDRIDAVDPATLLKTSRLVRAAFEVIPGLDITKFTDVNVRGQRFSAVELTVIANSSDEVAARLTSEDIETHD